VVVTTPHKDRLDQLITPHKHKLVLFKDQLQNLLGKIYEMLRELMVPEVLLLFFMVLM